VAPSLIVVVGQIRNRERLQRVGVLDVASAQRVRVVRDEWHASPAELAAQLHAPLGHWDVMHSTTWKYAWHEGRVWDRRGTRARVTAPGRIELRRALLSFGGFARLSIARVKARLDRGWLVRTVSVVEADGKEHVVARKRELSVVIDPVYDGIDLMFDGAWCPQLAQSLASALGVACEIDEDLR
jgi:hypothetical protein